jgi:multiple antibiotic resistance protein
MKYPCTIIAVTDNNTNDEIEAIISLDLGYISMDLGAVVSLTISLFFILDPFASLPMFISVTREEDRKTINSYANKAILVAAILLFVFMFVGEDLMNVFGVTMESFRVAGGLILILMAIELVFDLKLSKSTGSKGAPWVIIATPVLTGPGVITASILFSSQYGMDTVLVAGIIALLLTWVILRSASTIMRYVGTQVINIASRIIGLLIAAMGVEYIFRGALEWFQTYSAEAVSILLTMI